MCKKYLILLIIKIIFVLCENNSDQIFDYETEIDYEKQEESFRTTLKEYLTVNKLYGNETAEVPPERMRKIFIDAMTGGDLDNIPDKYIPPIEQLTEEFIDEQYNQKNRTVIKGSEVFDLLDINIIANRYNNLLEKLGLYDDEIDEDVDDDIFEDNDDDDISVNIDFDNIIYQEL